MAGFLSFALARLFAFLKDPAFVQTNFLLKKAMCRMCVGHKNRDIKAAEVVARGTRRDTGAFCFSAKIWVLPCGAIGSCSLSVSVAFRSLSYR